MAISARDKKMAALGGGLFLGGQVTNRTVGKSNSQVNMAGSVASYSGTTALGLVGLGELVEQIGVGSRAQIAKYGQDIMYTGRTMMSSARRAAPGLKLLAGRIAHGANKVI